MEYLFVGGLITGLVAFWNHARGFLMQAYSRVVVTVEVSDMAAQAVLTYLRMDCKASRFGIRTYRGWIDYVRPAGKKQAVAAEDLGKGMRVYWIGKLPVWVKRVSGMTNENADQSHVFHRPLSISFFRGTIDPDTLIINAIDRLNSLDASAAAEGRKRHQIYFVTGTDGKPARLQSGEIGIQGSAPSVVSTPENILSCRLLKWKHSDIGPHVYAGSALSRMYLSGEAAGMVGEIRNWLGSRDWHCERGLPWKRGFGLTGVPGTGKTTLVRGIAEDFDLPIHVFDLSTLYNDELRREWQRVQSTSPCIVLFDDIDAVFQDRANEHSSLTFDCFLNCLDGVSRSDGILTFITTNRPELLSDALTRPGRIDRMIEMGPPDDEGRQKIAARILSDWPDRIADVVIAGEQESGAVFERRCCDLALSLFWDDAGEREPEEMLMSGAK